MNRESPGTTGNDRRSIGNIQTLAELQQCPGCCRWCQGGAPVNTSIAMVHW
ncbi:hypothetical protein DPMN_162978 [Dreissena polymorpha]|uniref:Uncharacterized protein n=1 Tax=Dreissena polymorpha TaxID=45954 RepID=A0A9D4ESA8_DREPO|nr:hypothetical protein DPMN_162978 [Dreissena polymorpha]